MSSKLAAYFEVKFLLYIFNNFGFDLKNHSFLMYKIKSNKNHFNKLFKIDKKKKKINNGFIAQSVDRCKQSSFVKVMILR